MIRKAALKVGVFALLVLVVVNAYFALNHLKQLQRLAALTIESSQIQANVAAVLKDLTDMETGQRGYLLTADDSYLQPYNDAKSRIAADLATLREQLSTRSDRSVATLSQLESLATSKQDEIERSINLRQQGYRRRAFRLIDSNEGMQYMTQARSLLSSLSTEEAGIFASVDKERADKGRSFFAETVTLNLFLLAFTACLFGFIRHIGQILQQKAAHNRQALASREFQLKKLTSALSNQARTKTSAIEVSASLLLQNYGGFLPRQGHEYAEQIKEASAQMERLRQDLVGSPTSSDEDAVYDSVA
jgi:CHASE3 domain sensor protein